MSEVFRNIQETVKRYQKFGSREGEESSEDVSSLLAPGKIEQLTLEWRAPIRIGSISSPSSSSQSDVQMKPYYEIPPAGFDARDIKRVYDSMGVHVFVNKLGVKRLGITYTLNEEQAQQVELRIGAENLRLGRS